MLLDRQEVKFYILEIETDPPVALWEASFDGGATYVDGEEDLVTGYWSWLLAGADAATVDGPEVAVVTRPVEPKLRAVDDPEIVIERAPTIRYRH